MRFSIRNILLPGFMAIAVMSLLHLSCSYSSGVAGTATETTNGCVREASGKPVANAAVRLIDAKNWLAKTTAGNSVVMDSVFTDTNGAFSIRTPRLSQSNLQIDSKDEGLLVLNINDSVSPPGCSLSLSLKPYARIQGSLGVVASNQRELFFSGSACRATVGADNAFSADNVPEGVFPLIVRQQGPTAAQTALSGVVTLTAGSLVNTGVVIADTNLIPVEDFSQGWLRTMLGRVIGGGWWYQFSDTVEPPGNSSIKVSVSQTDALNGNNLQMKACLGNGLSYPYAGIGFQVGDPLMPGYNFSSLKKFTFRAKGRGSVRVTLETVLLDKIPGNWDHFGAQISLPAAWTKIEIPVDSLKLLPGSPADQAGVKWREASSSLRRIEFTVMYQFTPVGDTVEAQFDDIAFEGVSIGSLVR